MSTATTKDDFVALVRKAESDLEKDLELYFDNASYPNFNTAKNGIKTITERVITDLIELEKKINASDDDDNPTTPSPTFDKKKSADALKEKLEKITQTLTTNGLNPAPTKVKEFTTTALQAHEKIMELYLGPTHKAPTLDHTKFLAEFNAHAKTICDNIPDGQRKEYEKLFADLESNLKNMFDFIVNEPESANIEAYVKTLKADVTNAMTRARAVTSIDQTNITTKTMNFIQVRKYAATAERKKNTNLVSSPATGIYGKLPASSTSSSSSSPSPYGKIVFPPTLKELGENLVTELRKEKDKARFNFHNIDEALNATTLFLDGLPAKLAKPGITQAEITALRFEMMQKGTRLLHARTVEITTVSRDSLAAFNAYEKQAEATFDFQAKKIKASLPPPPPPPPPAPSKAEAPELYAKYEQAMLDLTRLQSYIEERHSTGFTLFDNNGKAISQRTESYLRLLKDLPNSPKLRADLAAIKDVGEHPLNIVLEKHEKTRKFLEDFFKKADEALTIMQELNAYHIVTNSTVSRIVTLDPKKTENEIFTETAKDLGITVDPSAVDPAADLVAGRETPGFTGKLKENEMRVSAIKTASDTKIAVAETIKDGLLRAVIYDATDAYSIDKLLQKVLSGIADDALQTKIRTSIKNAYYKKMILKEGAIANILAMHIPEQQAKSVAETFHNEFMLRNFQKFQGYDLPSDEVTRLAISMVNSMVDERPNEPININKAPSPAFAYAVMLVCAANRSKNDKTNSYQVSNNTRFICVQPPSEREIHAFTEMMRTHNVGAEKFAAPEVHLQQTKRAKGKAL